ncbi:MFS transporter [Glaciihabitans arcticus]|uniref:MFS transporter n=1 Tax=Glaciihabitans arcticus TaxID=2668039 RepID=A0A4Q9GTX4_9MICO|nr:MFS transporter [Glaciihabitans arcticus]TBN57068.1 MFS transporter [Glaciihabitans arcticus]
MTAPATPKLPLGRDFGKLWAASVTSNLADGLGRTAIPLIATTLTKDPVLIAGISALAFVPWLLFGVLSGVIVDRVDRRYAMAVANGLRVLAAIAIALLITTGAITIWWLYAAVLVFGLAETVYDNATIAVMPSVVPKGGLERANSRMQAADTLVQNFVATPIAGVLFAVAIVIPIWSTAAGFAVAGALALLLPASAARALRAEPAAGEARATAGADVREAMSFLLGHRFLRNLIAATALIGLMLTLAQATSILFLLDTLSVPIWAIGFATAGVGVGAIAGALLASFFVEKIGRGRVMFLGTLVSSIAMALTGFGPNVWIAVFFYALSAFGISVWNVSYGSLRQELIPGPLLGRTIGMIRTITWGLFPIAAVLGGFLSRIDLRLPFWVGGGLSAIVVLVAARLMLSSSDQKPYEAPASDAAAEAQDDVAAEPQPRVEPVEPL